jgi:hypothetical protein
VEGFGLGLGGGFLDHAGFMPDGKRIGKPGNLKAACCAGVATLDPFA